MNNLTDYSLVELFRKRVSKIPHAAAVIENGRIISFQTLYDHASSIANALRNEAAVARGDRVALVMERSSAAFAAMFGIQMLGAAYVPVLPSLPEHRQRYLIVDSGSAAIVTSAGLPWAAKARVPVLATQHLRVGAGQPQPHSEPDDLAVVLYTSGSSGSQKGVMIDHAGIVDRFLWMNEVAPWAPGEVACAKTNLSFVDSLGEIFRPLCQGHPVLIASNAQLLRPANLLRELDAAGVNRLIIVPSLLRLWLSRPKQTRLPKLFISSGEALSSRLAEDFLRWAPESRLLNLYGMTESVGDATVRAIHS